jgi:hypothetical protein
MNTLISEARKKGFTRGAVCQIKGDVRVMTTGRIVDYNGNLMVMAQHPFFIRFRGEWCAEVLKKNK